LVPIGDFTIDIAMIEKRDLLNMRLLLPKNEYIHLKNRKNARLCRLRKKQKGSEVINNLETLEIENKKLRKIIERTSRKL